MGVKTKIKRNTAVLVPEEDIENQKADDLAFGENLNRKKKWAAIKRRIPCIYKLFKIFKKKQQLEDWEKEIESDESNLPEDIEINAPNYSSGESEPDERLEV